MHRPSMGLKVSRYARVPISQERYVAGWHRVILSPGVVIDPFIEHGLVTRTEGRSIERTELTVDVGGTYQVMEKSRPFQLSVAFMLPVYSGISL